MEGFVMQYKVLQPEEVVFDSHEEWYWAMGHDNLRFLQF